MPPVEGVRKVEHTPPSSMFADRLVQCNGLHEAGFHQWVFRPGMLFGAVEIWWGQGGNRDRPHEGLDVCCYRDRRGRVHALDTAIRVPVMYEGEVAAILEDFLGLSVFVRHGIHDGEGRWLYTVYGHTGPVGGVRPGRTLEEGDVLGTLAGRRGGKTGAPPHLHLTVAWVQQSVSGEALDWETMADPRWALLLDPFDVASFEHVVLRNAA